MYDVNDDIIQEIHFGVKSKAPPIQPGNLTDLVNPSISVPGPKVGGEEEKGVKTILNVVILMKKIYSLELISKQFQNTVDFPTW